VEGSVVGEIQRGLALLAGFEDADTPDVAVRMADKIAALRIFDDEDGKMNLSASQVEGSMLVISQFTLYGDTRRGRRPSFIAAARPEIAEPLYDVFAERFRHLGYYVATGVFGAHMEVELHNDGPVTLIFDSAQS
jgi:D-tyrosyl-tRNA(Tyr) deacylase